MILLITCAEIAMALTYFQLTAEDYNWWWRSFLSCPRLSEPGKSMKVVMKALVWRLFQS